MTDIENLAHRAMLQRASHGFETSWDNFAEKCMLIVTEVSEAVEADRLGQREHVPEELADILIRLLDLTESLGINIANETLSKMNKNDSRPYKHGKRY